MSSASLNARTTDRLGRPLALTEMTREERDALIFQLKAEGRLSQTEIGQRVGLSGTRVGRILNGTGGATSAVRSADSAVRSAPKVEYRCATPGCAAVLKSERWVFSPHKGVRYCLPGQGCWTWSEKKRARMRREHVAPKEVEA